MGRVGEVDGLADRLEALADHADVLEERGERPHDPAGHRVEAQRQRRGGGDGADRGMPALPEHEREADDGDDEKAVQHREPEVHEGDDPHLVHEGAAGVLDRLAGVGLLGAGVGEELHRLDVGVAVDDAAGDRRAGVGERLRGPADARDRPGDEPDVEAEPDDERQREARIGAGEEPEGAGEVDDRVDDGVEGLERDLAHRRGGLHHAVGDAAGKVALEPADRLLQHVPVRAPAHDGADVRHERLVEERRRDGLYERPGDEDEERHRDQLDAVARPDLGGRGGAEHVDDAASVGDEPDLDYRHGEDRDDGEGHHLAGGPQVGAEERPEPCGGHVALGIGRVGVDERLEEAEHGGSPGRREGRGCRSAGRLARGPGRSGERGGPVELHAGTPRAWVRCL